MKLCSVNYLVLVMLWCKAEPVVPNGDAYFGRSFDLEEACDIAVSDCQKIYGVCESVDIGDDSDLYKWRIRVIDGDTI